MFKPRFAACHTGFVLTHLYGSSRELSHSVVCAHCSGHMGHIIVALSPCVRTFSKRSALINIPTGCRPCHFCSAQSRNSCGISSLRSVTVCCLLVSNSAYPHYGRCSQGPSSLNRASAHSSPNFDETHQHA